MKVELQAPGVGRIDIGCFRKPFSGRDDDQCIALIETKGLTQGLDYATNQAHGYANSFPSCKVVLATNGYCYKAYERVGDTFATEHVIACWSCASVARMSNEAQRED